MAKLKNYRKENNFKFFPFYFGKIKNIFKYIYNIFKNMFRGGGVLYATGSHIITGYPGSGKTLLMNDIINSIDNTRYFFYCNIEEFSQSNVYKIELNDIFSGKKQIKQLPTIDKHGRKLYGLILDEINLNFNRRVNQSKDYTDLFIGLIEMVVTHRHQKIPRLYFIGQKLELQDSQLISLFKYQHDIIKCKKRYRYWNYYERTEQKPIVERIPIKLKVLHRIKDINDQFLDFDKQKIKIKWYDLLTYDTLALGKTYSTLPKMTIKY